MKKRLSRLLVVPAALVLIAGFSSRANASVITIDFSGQGGGSVTQSGSDFTGADIPIASLQVDINGVKTTYDVSGSITDGCDANGCGTLSFDTKANTISIVGDVEDLGINSEITLLSGSFSSFGKVGPFFGFSAFNGAGPDTKSADLLTALSIPTDTQFHFFGFSIFMDANGAVTSSDITNTAPEPASILMLGLGFLSSAGVMRRRLGFKR